MEDKDFIFIKTDDNEAKELFITPKTYLELFPPLEKNALAQGQAGDCFFVAATQALYSNPKTRSLVLEMFKEEFDGTLKVSLSGYKKEGDEVVLKDKNAYEITDAASEIKKFDKKRLSFQYEGMRLLEMCLNKTVRANAHKNVMNQYNLYKALIETLEDEDDFVEFEDGLKYTKKEMELFVKLIDKMGDKDDVDKIANQMISLKDAFVSKRYFNTNFDEDAEIDTTLAMMDDLDYTDEEYEYLECVLNRYKQYFIDNPEAKSIKLNDFITQNCFMAINNEEKPYDYVNYGGSSAKVFNMLGLEARKLEDEEEIEEFFSQPDLNSNYAATAVSLRLHNKPYILPSHAYSIRADKVGDVDVICAQNPHNGAQDIMMTPQTAAAVFDSVYAAKI